MRSPMDTRFPIWLLGLVFAGLLGSGCENTIEPFSNDATYSIYGALSLNQQRQFIRIKPLHAPLGGARTYESLVATVTLHNVTSGRAETLEDSVVTFRDANLEIATHNYWTDRPVQPNAEYRLVIEGPNGTTTEATTATPPIQKANISPKSGHCRTSFFVDFPGIEKAKRILAVRVGFDTRKGPMDFVIHEDIYNASHGKPDNAFVVFAPHSFLSEEFDYPQQDPRHGDCKTICSNLSHGSITVEYTYAGSQWYGNIPEVLDHPINSPSVTNGSGYFGSVATTRSTIPVNTESLPSDHPACN